MNFHLEILLPWKFPVSAAMVGSFAAWEACRRRSVFRVVVPLRQEPLGKRTTFRERATIGTRGLVPRLSNRRTTGPSPQNQYNSTKDFGPQPVATGVTLAGFLTANPPATRKPCAMRSRQPSAISRRIGFGAVPMPFFAERLLAVWRTVPSLKE
jgi:hypothetical protein